jgi:hypothetical protein
MKFNSIRNASFFSVLLLFSCQTKQQKDDKPISNVVTTDIDLFWNAYDIIIKETDTVRQERMIDSMYLSQGSVGLEKIIEARNYTAQEYVSLINRHPKFWSSIRKNTLKSKEIADEMNVGIQKLKMIYPALKPAKIYFTVGAMRTNGTTQDSLVLIGSELAMAEKSTDVSEFEGRTKQWLENYISTNPIDKVVLLNLHEYVHTQQKAMPNGLLYQVLYEGIAELVSVKALGVVSSTPAVEFGLENPLVKQKFEEEMFYEKTYEWMWSNAPNEFDVRDLGYYIGYYIADSFYNQSANKAQSINDLIQLDYGNPTVIDAFIDGTNFFSKSIETLRAEDSLKRPKLIGIQQFENGSNDVNYKTKKITIRFSEPLSQNHTGVDYGPLGENTFPKVLARTWSEDSTLWTLDVELEPEMKYQIMISNNFRNELGFPLQPYLIDFATSSLNGL